jgi:hypothetical protein
MTGKRITKAEVLQAESDVTQIRMALDGEAELLAQNYNPRLIAYCALTTSMRMAEKAGLGPVQFAKLAADTLNLFSKAQDGYPVAISFVGLSDPKDE